jgi:hypothetical protein
MKAFGADATKVVAGRRRYNAERRREVERRCSLLLPFLASHWSRGEPTRRELAEMFGVSEATISRDLKRLKFISLCVRRGRAMQIARMTNAELDRLSSFGMPKPKRSRRKSLPEPPAAGGKPPAAGGKPPAAGGKGTVDDNPAVMRFVMGLNQEGLTLADMSEGRRYTR